MKYSSLEDELNRNYSLMEDTVISCGVWQFSGMKPQASQAAFLIAARLYSLHGQAIGFDADQPPCASVLFSDTVKSGRGDRLMEFLIKRGFGQVVCTDAVLNPNSGNMIKTYIFSINHDQFYKWFHSVCKRKGHL